MRHPQGHSGIPPQLDCDPGRVRHQPFFDKNNCQKGEVKPKLVHVDWLPQHGGGMLRVTSVNKVADRFKAVSAELSLREKPFEMKWTRWLPGLVTLREYRGGDQPGSHDQTKDHGAHS